MSRSLFDSLVPGVSFSMLTEILDDADTRELAAMNRRMDYYRNSLKPGRPPSMSDDTYHDREAAWVGIPLAALLVKTIAGALYQRDVIRTTGNEQYDAALEPVWKHLPLVMQQNAALASVIGDTVLRIAPDWRTGLRVTVWDGRHVVPIYHPEDPEQVIGLIYDYLAESEASQTLRALGRRGLPLEPRLELITRHLRDPLTGSLLQPGIRARFIDGHRVPWADETESDAYNPYGDFLDGIYWRNAPDPCSARGQSDLEHLEPMLETLNESTTDARLLLEWNVYPILKISGDMDEAVKYSHKAVLAVGHTSNGTPGDAELLEWSGNMEGFRTYYDHILALVHECARIPAIATGDLSGLGQVSSGRAYEILMRPFLDKIAERERFYEVQELDLMATMIAVLSYMGRAPFTGLTATYGLGFPQPDPVKIDTALAEANIEWTPLQLAEDAIEEATVHSQRIGAGYESIETAIRETHPDWSDDRIREELERVGSGAAATTDASADLRIAAQRAELLTPDGGNKPTAPPTATT